MNKLYVTAEVKAQSEHIQSVSSLLNTLARHSLEEPGCDQYQILQSNTEADTFLTFEVWASEEAEREHWATDHLKVTLEQLTPLLAGEPAIKKYNETK